MRDVGGEGRIRSELEFLDLSCVGLKHVLTHLTLLIPNTKTILFDKIHLRCITLLTRGRGGFSIGSSATHGTAGLLGIIRYVFLVGGGHHSVLRR